MSLRDWFRRHGNVFSISTREVVAESGDEDMLVEDYGMRAIEAERAPGYGARSGPGATGTVVRLDVSEDELADEESPPDSAS
jgi:hypothetical protein